MKYNSKEIISILLFYYIGHLERMKATQSLLELKDYLMESSIFSGVCFVIMKLHIYHDLTEREWIKDPRNFSKNARTYYNSSELSYWNRAPGDGQTKEEVLELIQYRIDKLKDRLNEI